MRKLVAILFSMVLSVSLFATTKESANTTHKDAIDKNQKCVTCHLKENRSLVNHWENSEHKGANVGCYSCHAASKDDPLAYEHEGVTIRTVQTPNDCAFCHEKQVKEVGQSHHATAGEIMASLDNMLAEVIASFPDTKADAVNGCWHCHGGIIKAKKDNNGKMIYNAAGAPVMDYMTWPNSGIGRINHDGSKGACNACHSRHDFSASRARQPENCGKCHLGPDHPQKEIYEESKHGIAYYAAPKEKVDGGMNIYKKGDWILGKDYNAAPTCSTCHMGGYVKGNGSVQKGSHNVGDRISWTLRPAISQKLNRVTFEDGTVTDIAGETPPKVGDMSKHKEFYRDGDKLASKITDKKIVKVLSWKDRRDNMEGVCKNCHSEHHVKNFYEQFDSLVNTYNEKFAKPGAAVMKELAKDKILINSQFQDELGFIWFEIWHHEGRRARHGAAMQAPDYTHWHGMYEVSLRYYNEFWPRVLELAEHAGPEMKAKYEKMHKEWIDKPENEWYKTGGNPELMKAIDEENKRRYKQ